MLASSDWVGLCPVTMTSPAFSSALASVASKTAGGQCVELVMVWRCMVMALVVLSTIRLTNSVTSNKDLETQSVSVSTKLTVGKTKHRASSTAAPAHV